MTNEEILKKAIEKAKANGWNLPFSLDLAQWIEKGEYQMIIFSHQFAKAFWVDSEYCEHCDTVHEEGNVSLFCWQFHLMEMVVSEDPIKYLEQFI